jgi:hypothetical protein
MRDFWEDAGLESIETRVIRIPTVYADFDDFWDSNVVPVGDLEVTCLMVPSGGLAKRRSADGLFRAKGRLRQRI